MKEKIISFIKDIISPKKCYSCKVQWYFLCPKCLSKLDKFKPICYICKKPSKNFEVHKNCKSGIYFDNLLILTKYNSKIIQKLIKNSKFYWKKDILEDFWLYLYDLFKRYFELRNDIIVSPAPMHFFRKLQRWYNHSEILSKIISKKLYLRLENKLIKRVKNTKQQSRLKRKDRLSNLENAFKIVKNNIEKIDKKEILLIDDVVSTWATLNQISSFLKKYGAKKVICLVIASD